MRNSLFLIICLIVVVYDSMQMPEPNPFFGAMKEKFTKPKKDKKDKEKNAEAEKPAAGGEAPKKEPAKKKEPPVPVPEKQEETEIPPSACDEKSGEHLAKIKELRAKIDEMEAAKSSPVYEYSRGDEYLTRWLIRCNMAVDECKTMIEKHLVWRKQMNVDNLEKENWSEIQKKYPMFTDTFDKAQRPILEWWIDSWDITTMTQKGPIGIKTLLLWFVRALEKMTHQMYEINVQKKGKCATQAVALLDMEDIEDATHTCQTCLQLLQLMGNTYETHYPNLFNKLHFVNVDDPAAAKVMQSFVSGFTQKDRILSSIKYYENKEQWEGPLNEIIDPSERGEQFGGTKQRQM